MRSVLTISIPEEKKKDIERRAKKAGKTVSAYIISVLDYENTLIGEDELLEIIKQSDKDYKAGKSQPIETLEKYLKDENQ